MYQQPGPYVPPPPRKKSPFKGCVIAAASAFGALVVIGGIGAALGSGGSDGGGTSAAPPVSAHAAASSSAAKKKTSKGKKKVENGIGREYRDGKFAFTVTKIKKGVHRVGDQYFGETAQGQFVLIYVTVHNIGNEARTFDSSSQKLKDTQGRKFNADEKATFAMGDKSKAFLEDINPGNGVHGILVFDVPKGIKIASIELHDSPFSGGVTVPLRG